jgi:hypothetical protein
MGSDQSYAGRDRQMAEESATSRNDSMQNRDDDSGNERDKERAQQKIHLALGWWGRGFIEGAAYTMDLPNNDKAMKKVTEFGLTVDVVTAHLDAYCRTNPDHTPFEGVQELLLTALK